MRADSIVGVRSERQPIAFDAARQAPIRIGDFFFVYFLLNGVEQPFFDQTWQLPLVAPIDFATP